MALERRPPVLVIDRTVDEPAGLPRHAVTTGLGSVKTDRAGPIRAYACVGMNWKCQGQRTHCLLRLTSTRSCDPRPSLPALPRIDGTRFSKHCMDGPGSTVPLPACVVRIRDSTPCSNGPRDDWPMPALPKLN